MQQKVVIIGHSYSSRLSLIRSVAKIGCEVSVIVLTGYKSRLLQQVCQPCVLLPSKRHGGVDTHSLG